MRHPLLVSLSHAYRFRYYRLSFLQSSSMRLLRVHIEMFIWAAIQKGFCLRYLCVFHLLVDVEILRSSHTRSELLSNDSTNMPLYYFTLILELRSFSLNSVSNPGHLLQRYSFSNSAYTPFLHGTAFRALYFNE